MALICSRLRTHGCTSARSSVPFHLSKCVVLLYFVPDLFPFLFCFVLFDDVFVVRTLTDSVTESHAAVHYLRSACY